MRSKFIAKTDNIIKKVTSAIKCNNLDTLYSYTYKIGIYNYLKSI